MWLLSCRIQFNYYPLRLDLSYIWFNIDQPWNIFANLEGIYSQNRSQVYSSTLLSQDLDVIFYSNLVLLIGRIYY